MLIARVLLSIIFAAESSGQGETIKQWPGFRGPCATGILDHANTPVEWDVETGRNIKWKTKIPVLGHSCPVIWNDYIFITTAVSGSGEDYLKVGMYGDIDMVDDESIHEFRVYCLDKLTGKVIWDRLPHAGVPGSRRHTKTSHANYTTATEGKHLVVYFGSEGLYCYDFETGREIWKMSGGGDAPVPTPVIAHDLIYLNNAHSRYSPIDVVRPEAKGDIALEEDSTTNEFIVWSIKRGGAYMQTPLIYGEYLYNLQVNGSLSCYHATTGELLYRENLGVSGGLSASGIASDGKLYFTAEKGMVYLLKAGPEYQQLAVNHMGDICMVTPAISEATLYFRTASYLVAVSEE